MYESFAALLVGLLTGIFTGMLPGMGMLVITIIIMPWLLTISAVATIIWFATVLITHQFIGSVVGIYYGIPTTESHYPSATEGFNLYKRGYGNYAIQTSAISHVISMALSLVLLYFLTDIGNLIITIFGTKIQAIMVMLAIASVFLLTKESLLIKIFFLLIGFSVGFFGEANRNYLHYQVHLLNMNFSDGIPIIPFVVGVFVMPIFLQNHNILLEIKNVTQLTVNLSNYNHYLTSIFHSIIGFIFGLTPMLTSDIASNFSYVIQKRWKQHRKSYNNGSDLSCIAASESAASSGAVVSLVPLLLFGIPITLSEGVLYEILLEKQYSFGFSNYNNNLLPSIIVFLTLASIINYILSGPFAYIFSKVYAWFYKYATAILFCGLFASVAYQGYITYNLSEYLMVIAISFGFGYWLRKYNLYLLVFSGIMANHTFDVFDRSLTFIRIYFFG